MAQALVTKQVETAYGTDTVGIGVEEWDGEIQTVEIRDGEAVSWINVYRHNDQPSAVNMTSMIALTEAEAELILSELGRRKSA